MKIQLTIKTSYLPTWGAYEGVRELVQNARDAEFEHNAPLKLDHYGDSLRIENEGVTLPLKALLLGHTTKLGRSDTIGKFGEGLKLGILALVRAGHSVKIRNGSEVWTPSIERSDVFDEDVLTFDIQKGRQEKGRLRIEVGGVNKSDWDVMRKCFLFVSKPKKGEAVETYDGTLLTGDYYRGRVYVKGIYVQTDPSLQYGYDLRDADLDRDRKMVESWNLKYTTRRVLLAAVNSTPSMLKNVEDILSKESPETNGLDSYQIPEKVAEAVAAKFVARHGENAIPVESLAESADVEHLGKRGVVVPEAMGAALSKVMGDIGTVKENLRKEVAKTYSWHEMDATEKASLTEAIELVNGVEAMTLNDVIVVDFNSNNLQGQFKDGRFLIAHKYLSDPDETLAILVHEVAHRNGDSDGDKGHVARIEDLWKGIVALLRKGGK